MRNRLNKGAGRKVAIFFYHDHENTLEFIIMIMGFPREKHETPFETPKLFHFIPNVIKTPSSFLSPSPTLKKDLIPLIFFLKLLRKFLEIGLNASGNNNGAGFFTVKPIGRT